MTNFMKDYDDLTPDMASKIKSSMMPDAIGMTFRRALEMIWMTTPDRTVQRVEEIFRREAEHVIEDFKNVAKKEGRS